MTSITTLLREILSEGQSSTQSEIQQALEQKGIATSQPKISRLLHQIGAVKLVDHQGKTHYRLPHAAGLIHELVPTHEKNLIRQWVLDVVANETTIIIHTTPGAAGMIARILDQHRVDLDILGSIAGDDTIFVAPRHNQQIKATVRNITQLFHL